MRLYDLNPKGLMMYVPITKEITARGVRKSANRLDVLMLAYSDILRFMDDTIEDMVADEQATRGLHATTRELHTLRDFLMGEVEDLEEFADRIEKEIAKDKGETHVQ